MKSRHVALLLAFFLLIPNVQSAAPPRPGDDLPSGARLRIGSPRMRHGGLVRWLSFSPDGKSLASASHDRTVSIWDVPSGKERLRLVGHEGDVVCLSFSADGKSLASSAADGTVRIWSLSGAKAGEQVAILTTTADTVDAVAYSPDGKRLAYGTTDGVLVVLDSQRRELFKKQIDRGIRVLAWSADSKWLATTGTKTGVSIWEAATGKAVRSQGSEVVQCLAFAPRGSELIAWGDEGTMRQLDAVKGDLTRSWKVGDDSRVALLYQIAFRGDGKSIFAGSTDGSVEEWDTKTGKRLRHLTNLHSGRVTALAVHGGMLATGGADHAIRLHDVKTGKALTPAVEVGPVLTLSTTKDNTLVALHGALRSPSGEVRLWDLKTGKPRQTPKLPSAVAVVGQRDTVGLWLVNTKGQLLSIDPAKKTETVLDKEGPLAALARSEDGKVLAGVLRNGMVPIYRKGKRQEDARGRERGASPVLSADGAFVAVVGKAANVAIFDTSSGREAPGVVGHAGGTLVAAFSPDGRTLATGGRDRYLRLWEMQSRRQRVKAVPHADWLSAVAYSPDGRLVATATMGGLVTLVDARTGRLETELRGHRGPVTGLLFADGSSLVSGGQDGTILVWDVAKLKLGGLSPKILAASERAKFWQELANEDPILAALAARELARDPANTVKQITESIKLLDAKQIAKWIEELDHEKFQTRENASKQLLALGHAVEGTLRKALANKPALEQHRRIEKLLNALKTVPRGENLRAIRAVELLEQIGGGSSLKKLQELARGAEDAELTNQARSAVQRMKK